MSYCIIIKWKCNNTNFWLSCQVRIVKVVVMYRSRDSSVGRALDWRSKGPRFDPGSRQFFLWICGYDKVRSGQAMPGQVRLDEVIIIIFFVWNITWPRMLFRPWDYECVLVKNMRMMCIVKFFCKLGIFVVQSYKNLLILFSIDCFYCYSK